MNVFESYIADQLPSLNNDAAYDDADVFARLRESFKVQNREEFETKEQADLFTADALSPYADITTLSGLKARADTATPVEKIIPPKEPVVEPAPEDTGTALGFSVDNAQKLFGSAVSTIGDLVGVEGISQFGQEYVAKQEREILENNYQSTYNKGGIETLSEDGAGAFLGWLGESILENFATTGFALAGGATAAALSGPLAAVVGAATLTGTTALGVGEVRQELEDKGVYDEGDALFATGAGLVVGLLDRFGGKGPAKGAIVSALAQRGVLKDLGIAAVKEFGTEGAQEAAVIGSAAIQGAKYEPTEFYNRIIDAGIIGGAMGAGTKGTVRALSGIVPNAETLEEAPLEDAEGTAQATPADDTATAQEPADGTLGEPKPAPGTGETVRQVTLDDGSTFDVDASIAPLVRDINNAGYTTAQSDSGLLEDYEGTDGADRYTNNGYIAFPLDGLSDAQVAEVTKAAQDAGLAVDSEAKVFGVPSLNIRTGISESGKTSQEITREAGFAASEELGYTDDQIDQGGRDTIVGASIGGTPLKSAQGLRGGDAFMEFINLRDEKANELKALDPNISNDEIKARWSAFGSALVGDATVTPEDVATDTTGAVDGEPVTPAAEVAPVEEVVEDVIQGDLDTIPNTAGIVVTDDNVVDATVVQLLRDAAAQQVALHADTSKTNIDALRDQAEDYDPVEQKSKKVREAIYATWAEYFPGTTSYAQMRVQAIKAAREEIITLLALSGRTLDVSSAASTQTKLHQDLANGTISVDPADKVRGGALSVKVPGQKYTYAEALSAITEAYGRGATGVAYNDAASNKHAAEVTDSMFSPQARAFVSAYIASGIDRSYIMPRVDVNTDLESFYKSRGKLKDEFAGFVGPSQPVTQEAPSALAVARAAGLIPEQEALGDKVRRVLDKGAEAAGLKTEIRTNKVYKIFADAVQFSILAAQNTQLSRKLRDIDGIKQTARDEAHSIGVEFKKAAKEYAKTVKDSDAKLNEIYTDIITGRQTVLLKDEAKAASAENILTDGQGNAYLKSSDGVSLQTISLDMLGPLSTFLTARLGEQKILIDAVNAKITADLEDMNAINGVIIEQLAYARTTIDLEGGFGELTFKAFEDTQTRLAWLESLRNVDGNYLGVVLENTIENIARATVGKRATDIRLQDKIKELHGLFTYAAETSSSLEEFNAASNDVFLTEAGDTLNMQIGLVLGVNDGKGIMTKVGKEVAKSLIISERIDSQVAFNKRISQNGNYAADIYSAYLGNEPEFVRGMDTPTSDKEKAARAAYEASVAEKILEEEESKPEEMRITPEEAAIKAGREVQRQVELVKESNRTMSGGGQDQHLLFSALASSRAKNDELTPEFQAFFGKIDDPNLLMEETINRMRENSYAMNITTFIHDHFVGNGVFENQAAVDAYNIDNPHNQIDFDTLVPFKLRDKNNISEFGQFFATPIIAQSQEQFSGVDVSDNKALNMLQKYGAEFRLLHTVASLPTGMLNLIAGSTTMLMAGGNPLRVAEGSIEHTMATELYNVIIRGKAPSNDTFVRALTAVAGSNAKAGQIQRDKALSQGTLDSLISIMGIPKIEGARATSTSLRKAWKGYIGAGEMLYRFGDLLPKLVAYENIRVNMESEYGDMMSEAEIDDYTTRNARDMSFDIAQVPSIVRTAREKFLMGGAFLSYDSLVFATVTKNLRNVAELRKLDAIKLGTESSSFTLNGEAVDFDPGNAAHVAEAQRQLEPFSGYAAKRYANMATSLMAPILFNGVVAAAAIGLADLFSADDDEVAAFQDGPSLGGLLNGPSPEGLIGFGPRADAIDNMRQLMPDYYKNSTISPIGVTENGAVEWMDTGRMTNHGKFMEGWNAIANSDPGTSVFQAGVNGVDAMLGGYWSLGFGFNAAANIINNENNFGQQIYNERDTAVGNAADIAKYILNDLGGTSTIGRGVKAGVAVLTDADSLIYNPHSGEASGIGKTVLEHVGVRIKTFDPAKEFKSRIQSESYKLRADKALFRSHIKSYNKVPDDKIASQLIRLRSAHFDSMSAIRDKIGAARGLGLSEAEIKLSLKGVVSATESKALLAGLIPEYDIGKMGERNTKSSNLRRIEQQARTNFGVNFERAKALNNSLPINR